MIAMTSNRHACFNALKSIIYIVSILTSSVLASSDIEAAPGEPAGGSIILGGGYDISLTITGDFSSWSLNPTEIINTKPGTIIIDVPGTGNSWALAVSSDSPTGQLTEYENFNYVQNPKKITESLKIREDGGNAVDLAKGGQLISGKGDAVISFSFEQQTSWYDEPLPEGRFYHMVVTFTGSRST